MYTIYALLGPSDGGEPARLFYDFAKTAEDAVAALTKLNHSSYTAWALAPGPRDQAPIMYIAVSQDA